MTDITELAQRVRHWADMSALTSERVSCLSVEQLEEIANTLGPAPSPLSHFARLLPMLI